MVVLATALRVDAATNYTWTNTGVADYWTNAANWAPAVSYPGAATGDSAYLTNQVGLAYTNVLDTGLANTLSLLSIANPLGEAWLRVVNTTLTNTSLTLDAGGRLQIDGGVVTGVTALAWTGNSGALWLDNGGQFFTSGAKTIGAAGGVTALVTSASSPGSWDMNGGGLTIGAGSGHDNLITIDSGTVLTNVAGVTHAGSRNSLIVAGASKLFGRGGLSFNNAGYGNTIAIGGGLWDGLVGTLAVGGAVNSSNHTLNVTGGTVSNFLVLQVGGASGANYNSVNVTGGSLLMTNRGTSQVQIGSASGGGSGGSFNSVVVSNSVLVSGTDNISYVGYNSASNSVTLLRDSIWQISSQGSASPGQLTIGFGASTGNVVMLNGGMTTNGQGAGSMANGPSIVIGNGAGSLGNMLIVTNNGRLLVAGGGIRIGTNGATGNRLVLNGGASSGAVVSDSGVLVIGGAGSGGNSLSATNARLTTGATTIGSGSSNNYAFIAENVTWNFNVAALTIGTGEAFNNLLTNHGGIFTNVGAVIIGNGAAASGNGLVIDNGGIFRSASITVGGTGSQSNYLNIGGAGATTLVTNGLITIGSVGAGFNTLTVTNANVFTTGLSIGAKSSNNTVTVLGDTVWNLRNDVVSVGDASGSGGANVMSSTGNVLVVNGGTLTNANGVNIGDMGGNMNTAFNTLLITNGGKVFNNGGVIIGDTTPGVGLPFASSNNTLMVTGSGSLMTNAGNLFLGYNATAGATPGGSNRLTIADGGKFILAGAGTIGFSTTGSGGGSNLVIVTDAGSVWSNGSALTIGNAVGGVGNRLLITNGGAVAISTVLSIGPSAAATSNDVTVTGPDSQLTIGGTLLITAGSFNTVTVAAGARITQFGTLSIGSSGHSNTVTVTGPNAVYQFSHSSAGNAIRVGGGANATGNQLIIRDGGMVIITNSLGSANSVIGGAAGAKSNSVTVAGVGSTWTNLTAGATTPALVVGDAGASSNRLQISDRGVVVATAITAGGGAGANHNSVFIESGGLLQANTLTIGAGLTGNTISNVGGIYQFTVPSPIVTPNGAGNIALSGGTISFHGISNADVTNNLGNGALKGITFAGANTFMLNAASNTLAGQTYTFQTVSGNPSNYVNLALVNGHTAYRGGDLTIGGTGSLLISNTTASVTGSFTNQGQTKIVNSTATFANGVINSGGLALQTATLTGSVTNQASGTLLGNGLIVGDVTSLGTNSPGFSVGTLSITGKLTLASSAVTWMELAGGGTNDQLNVSQLLAYGGELVVTNITGFAYASGQTFQLFQFGSQTGSFSVTNLPDLTTFGLEWDTSQLNSAGMLMVVPEPSTIVLLGGGLLMLCCVSHVRRRR